VAQQVDDRQLGVDRAGAAVLGLTGPQRVLPLGIEDRSSLGDGFTVVLGVGDMADPQWVGCGLNAGHGRLGLQGCGNQTAIVMVLS
jgi:hypothetical protein